MIKVWTSITNTVMKRKTILRNKGDKHHTHFYNFTIFKFNDDSYMIILFCSRHISDIR